MELCKVRETMAVSEETLTEIINEMAQDGWRYDTVHFAMREASRRPAMAFLIFYKTVDDDSDER
ncbi:MAG: DUF4177 domain-containing protein [Deltaproteobacteria bacterium]|nr:DUF4177 domain-containing protein [bacterium]MCB9476637.1 DUF4177 domain-containing protein [Deltaproteobacteria bacterium]MCB9479584.1 DUF4177 domain-containing protein [Deltaproteobacteria bacterium]MCB9488820.1 DUF4177 domain-containing protein [Deltaproteobacteria bacterium]